MPTPQADSRPQLILASGSIYRQQLLQRLKYPFQCISPDIDESVHDGETPGDLALRLARTKAARIAKTHPSAVVIGSDQVAELGSQLLGKPGGYDKAIKQLSACSGQSVVFHTAACIRRDDKGLEYTHIDTSTVNFRNLTAAEIEAYVRADEPWDCAGSFKSEGLGSALFKSIDNHDPSAIIGLPMIWLTNSLRKAGVPLLD